MDKYHQSNPPTELKSVVLGRKNSRKGASSPAPCSPSSESPEDFDKAGHDAAWERAFVVPIAREMKKRGVGYMVITIRDDGKCAYILDTEIPENAIGEARREGTPPQQ